MITASRWSPQARFISAKSPPQSSPPPPPPNFRLYPETHPRGEWRLGHVREAPPTAPPSAPKSQDARPAAQGHEEHRLGPAQLCTLSAARGDVCVQDLSSPGPGEVMGVAETSGGRAGAGPGCVVGGGRSLTRLWSAWNSL